MSNADHNVRFYVTDGPVASSASEVNESYFREGLAAGHGGVRVDLPDGTSELIAGSRYLVADTRIRAEVIDGRLQVIYLGGALRKYADWVDYSEIEPSEYPLGE